MEKEYDLFERAQDHALLWRGRVHGLENARRKLEQLAQKTINECSVIHQPTRQVVALANIAQAKPEDADSGVEFGGKPAIGGGGLQRGAQWAGGVVVDGGRALG